jgi:putative thioredoxin
MENVVEVTDATFENVVLEGSVERPVVVDLWAAWCGPCRTLGPILEKIAAERDGEFLLAKLDIDANRVGQELLAAVGSQGIPTVVAFRERKPVSMFIGAYPEPAVREFVQGLLPTDAERVAEEARAEADSGDVAGAERRFREALEKDPENADAKLGLARILVDRGEDEEAEALARPLLPDPEAERILARVAVRGWAHRDGEGPLGFAKALAGKGAWREALDGMLHALAEDREAARAAMLEVFAVLGEDDPLVQEYRRKLAQALF